MDEKKRRKLCTTGWAVGDTGDFLDLTPEETRYIELKLSLSTSLRDERHRQGVTQVELARLVGSSQSRIAKMEACDPSVSVDLLLKALLSLGVTRQRLSRMIG